MSVHQDRGSSVDNESSRRRFLGLLGAGVGSVALGSQSVLGQSLLLRSGAGRMAVPRSSVTVGLQETYTFSHTQGDTLKTYSVPCGTGIPGTQSFTWPGGQYVRPTGTLDYTITFPGNQTLTVHETWSRSLSPGCPPYTQYYSYGRDGAGTLTVSYNQDTPTYTYGETDTRSATFTTSSWSQGDPEPDFCSLGSVEGGETKLLSLDSDLNIHDARSRSGIPLRISLLLPH
jgi:hypothetical protein